MFNANEVIHLSSLDILICESSSGAPAVISAYNPDDERVLHENDIESMYCN